MRVQTLSVPTLYQTTERQRKMHLEVVRDTLYMNKLALLSKLTWDGRLFPLLMFAQVHSLWILMFSPQAEDEGFKKSSSVFQPRISQRFPLGITTQNRKRI